MTMRRPHPLSTSLRLERLREEAKFPTQASDRHSQFLLYACLPDSPMGIAPKEAGFVDTGLRFEQPPGYQLYLQSMSPELFVQPFLDNEGRLLVFVFNAGNTTTCFHHGDPIALLSVLASVSTALLIEDEETHD